MILEEFFISDQPFFVNAHILKSSSRIIVGLCRGFLPSLFPHDMFALLWFGLETLLKVPTEGHLSC